MRMDLEREEERHKLWLCRIGFGLSAFGLALLFLHIALFLGCFFTRNQEILQIIRNPIWDWVVGSPIPWTTLIGSYLIWARRADADWQRRAGTLVFLNFIDLMLWATSHAQDFGWSIDLSEHEWFQHNLGDFTGWCEYILFATLAAEIMLHVGEPGAAEPAVGARALATIGVVFWAILFLAQTDWMAGWPLKPQPMKMQDQFLILIGTKLFQGIVTFQVTVLCLAAMRSCQRRMRLLNDDHQGGELLRSASEKYANNPDWWFDGREDQF